MTKWDTRDMSVNLANDGWTTCKRPDELSNGSLSDQNRQFYMLECLVLFDIKDLINYFTP